MLKLASAIFTTGYVVGAATVVVAIRRGHWQLVPAERQLNADASPDEEPAKTERREPVSVHSDRLNS